MTDKQEKIFEDDLTGRKNGRRYLKYARVPFTGTAITERIPDNPFNLNTLLGRTNYKDGKRHGRCEQFHASGRLESTVNFKNGELHGSWERYYENGRLYFKGNYKNGKQHGPRERFHENGQLESRTNFKNGKRHGLRKTFAANGQLLFWGALQRIFEDDLTGRKNGRRYLKY
ncbi:uncharacterized protein METZ01_LOCUS379012, partial [marine metagenome]